MEGKKKPYGITNIVSWGATVVIIGLLFKIQHWPYGTLFITSGLLTEAALFFLLGFQREKEEVHIDWTRVYPELSNDFKGELPTSSPRGGGGGGVSSTAALDKMLEDAKIGPELIGSLGEGLKTFGDKVANISKVADAGVATSEFTTKVKSASESYDKLSNAFESASANLTAMAASNGETKAYHEQVTNLAKNLSALNAVYELELQDSSAHLKSMNKFYHNMAETMQNFTESIEDSQQFKNEVTRLAKNLSSLNAIYGNMLSAMSQPRV